MKPLIKNRYSTRRRCEEFESELVLQAMYIDWKKIKGYKTPEPPNCQPSFKEFESRINQSTINKPEDESD